MMFRFATIGVLDAVEVMILLYVAFTTFQRIST